MRHRATYHRPAGASTASGAAPHAQVQLLAHLAPGRDWIEDPAFDPRTAGYGGHAHCQYVAHMFW